jgi:hypothetical protein
MKCKIFTSTTIKGLEDQINQYFEDLPSNSLLDCKLVYEPTYESETSNFGEAYTAMIIVRGDID